MRTPYEHNVELMQSVTPSLAYDGGDYEAWKKVAKQKLIDLVGLNRFTAVDANMEVEFDIVNEENNREIRFTFCTEKGYRSLAHMIIPHGVKKPPIMICLQGHSRGMHISLGKAKYPDEVELIAGGDRDFCVRAVKEGFCAIALEQRNFGECGGTDEGPQCLRSTLKGFLMGRTTIGERVWDISRLIDLLINDFSDILNTDTICVMGNSGGGTATAYTAALEDRVKLVIPSCAMATYKDSIGAIPHCSCNFIPHIAEYFDMGDLMALAFPKYFIQVSGLEDELFPFFAAEEVFNHGAKVYKQFGKEKYCRLVRGKGGHRFYADDTWPIVHELLD